MAKGRLVRVLSEWERAKMLRYAIYASRQNLPASTRAFIDFVAESVGRNPLFQRR